MGTKIRLSTIKLEGCGGCHMSLLDLHQQIIPVIDQIDLVYSPLNDTNEISESSIILVEGAVANNHNREIIQLAREKADVLIAIGSCSNFGGLQGLRNLYSCKEVFECYYGTTVSTKSEKGTAPNKEEVPNLEKAVQSINQVVKVDYYVPGCPPISEQIKDIIIAVIEGEEPVKNTKNLCDECGRERTILTVPRRQFLAESIYPIEVDEKEIGELEPHLLPRRKLFTEEVFSVAELKNIDQDRCFLEQGILCMGPATIEGCQARCLNGNMPCRGCFGPSPNAMEQGTKIIDALATILPAGAVLINDDIVGTGYRFSLPVSILPKIFKKGKQDD